MKKYLLKSNFLIIIALEEISANLANCWIFGKQIEAKFFNNCYLLLLWGGKDFIGRRTFQPNN